MPWRAHNRRSDTCAHAQHQCGKFIPHTTSANALMQQPLGTASNRRTSHIAHTESSDFEQLG